MLNSIRNFSKTIFAKILLFIVIIPFVFWGMGGVFTSGNTNSLAKIDSVNISTQDFIEHINDLRINDDIIRDNLDNNILEDLLSELVSKKILELQTNELGISISKKNLAILIKNNPNFFDDNNNFSRLKYEKFLLSNNLDAPTFEKRLKNRELQNDLFDYISGGIYSPDFLIKKIYEDQTKKIQIKYIDLKELYGTVDEVSQNQINEFIKQNNEQLKQDYFNYSYAKITPKILIGTEEFDQTFFNKIDEIENKILTGTAFESLISDYNLKRINRKNVSNMDETNNIDKRVINSSKQNLIDIIDMNEFYLIYKVDKVLKKIPDMENIKFINEIKEKVYNKKKYEENLKLIEKISSKNFTETDFNKIVNSDKSKIKELLLNSVRDNKTFHIDTVEIIYSLPIKSFTLGSDENKNIYMIKILEEKINNKSISKESQKMYKKLSNTNINKEILTAYDIYLNNKYKIKINQQTLERVKNYFR